MHLKIIMCSLILTQIYLMVESLKIKSTKAGAKALKNAINSAIKRRRQIVKCCGHNKCMPANSKTSKTNGTRGNNTRRGGGTGSNYLPSGGKGGASGGPAGASGGAAGASGGSGGSGSPSGSGSAAAGAIGGSSKTGASEAGSGGGGSGAAANPAEDDEGGGADGGSEPSSGASGSAGSGGTAGSAASGGAAGSSPEDEGEEGGEESAGGDTASGSGSGGTAGSGTSGAAAGSATGAAVGSGTTGAAESGSGGAAASGGAGSGTTSGAAGGGAAAAGATTITGGAAGSGAGAAAGSSTTGPSGSSGSSNGTSGGASGSGSTNGTAAGGTSGSDTSSNGTSSGGSNSTGSGASNSTSAGAGGSSNSSTNSTNSGAATGGGASGSNSTNSTSAGGSNSTGSSNSNSTSSTTVSGSSNTTTTKGPCKKPSCDPSVFARRRRAAAVAPTGNDGSFSRACNKTFFFGSSAVSWGQSYSECQKFGMVSIGIGKPEKQKCVTDAAKAEPKAAGKEYWTSKHRKNATCPKTYAMCDANEVIGPEISDLLSWASLMPDDMDKDICVTLALMAGAPNGLSQAFCDKKLNIMCEPKCTKPDCPTTCTKDATKVDETGKILSPDGLGTWVTAGGSKFLFTLANTTGIWSKGWDYCCSLGMKLAGFETRAKTDALAAAVKGQKLEADYWSSASQINCVGTWHFCSSDSPLERTIPWLSGQPDNWLGTEDYASISVDVGAGKLEMNDRNIGREFPYICEKIQ